MSRRLTPGIGSELLDVNAPASVVVALAAVPRHYFVPPQRQMVAYLDQDLPIGRGRRCPRPSTVAQLLSAIDARGGRWLVVGAGTGYIAACAASMSDEVVAVESDPTLAGECAFALGRLAFGDRVELRQSVPATTESKYDAIVVCGSLERSPRALLKVLAKGGTLVAPLRTNSETRLLTYGDAPRGHLRRDLGEIAVEPLPDEVVPC